MTILSPRFHSGLSGIFRICFPITIAIVVIASGIPLHARWSIDLDHDALSLYERGDPAFATLQWTAEENMTPSRAPAPPAFALYDHLDRQIRSLPVLPSKTATDTWTLPVPTDRLGYFEIRPLSTDAATIIPALGSRPAGRLTLAVVEKINPDPSHAFTASFLGIQGTTLIRQRDGQAYGWDAYPYLGIQSVGLGYQWGQWEADGPGTFEKNIARDKQPRWVREQKFVPWFHLNSIPMWAADPDRLPEKERKSASTQRIPPRDWNQWQAWLEKLVPYLVKNYDYLPERVYEVMWEPVIPWGWYGTPEEIVKTFEIAHNVIHRLDPLGKVAGPTLASLGDTGYYETLLEAGLSRYLDIVSVHPYRGYPPEKSAIPDALQRIRSVTASRLGRELPVIGTEFGYPQEKTGSALDQGYALAASVLIFKGEHAAKHTLFYLADYALEAGYGMSYNLVSGLPFGPRKISPKPGVPMIRAAIDQVGNADSVGKLDYFGANILGYVFRDRADGTLLAALWDASGANRRVDFDAGVPQAELVDAFGNRSTRPTADGHLELQLARSATYVRGISPQLYGEGRIAPLLDTTKIWKLYRGRPATETFTLTRDAGSAEPETAVARLTFDTAADINRGRVQSPVSLKKNSRATISFDVAATAPLGPAVGYVRIRENDRSVYRGTQRLEVLPELDISPLSADRADNGWNVTATVRNTSPWPWSGIVTLRHENAAPSTRRLALGAGAMQTLRFPVDTVDAARILPASLRFVSDLGPGLEQQGSLTFFTLSRYNPAEGDVWSRLHKTRLPVTSETLWKAHPDASYRGASDLSAEIGYAFDDNGLYIEIDVRDDVHRQEAAPGATWSQDSVQLAFDVAPGRNGNSNLLAETGERTRSEWTLAWTARGPEIFASTTPGGSPVPENTVVTAPGARLEGGRRGNRTLYRVTLPWTLLDPVSRRDGKRLGIAAAINDSDADTRPEDRRGLEFFGGILRDKDPAHFGIVRME
ncbi:hypothetical protein OPIT5_26870 [Opitutaceae bacterium TAV5]|nr:hypothetical protein OPIT5_26870 [Opitutaceae bacterium TAV5]